MLSVSNFVTEVTKLCFRLSCGVVIGVLAVASRR